MDITEDIEIQLQKDIYRESYYEFFKDAVRALESENQWDFNWHIEYICNILQREAVRIKNKEPRQKDIIINVPFRSSKSLMCTVIFPVWCWIIAPQMKFICTSYSGDLALEHSQLSRTLINSIWFQKYFSKEVRFSNDNNAKGFYSNDQGGFRKSVGVGGQITGSGGDFLIIDDPINPKKAASEVERKNALSFYDKTLYSRLNNPAIGVRIVVMQRLHQEDLSGHLLETRPEDHEHICIPAELSEDVNPVELRNNYKDGLFWPLRFSEAQIKSYNKALGTNEAAGQLQQRPSPEGGGIIKEHWLEIIEPNTIMRDLQTEPIHFYLDTAYKEKQEEDNDPNAFLACFKRQGYIYIINCHDEWLEFPDLCKYTDRYVRSNGYTEHSKIKVEPKASGISLVQQLRRTTNLNIIEGKTPKDDKVTRLNSISPTVESMRVKLIKGGWNKDFIAQVTSFPASKHDDMVDVFTAAVEDLLVDGDFDFMLM